ncbi:MAG: pyruvate dehydrogenase complex dihydrolipoamide acetyltransferase [Holosporales bacterium]
MPIKILMPALSPTMSEGNLVKWHKKEGDVIKAGQVLAEIETDKATMEVEAVDEGVLGRIIIPEGTENVPVNALIAVLLDEGEDASALDGFTAGAAASSGSTQAATPAAAPAQSPADSAPVAPAATPQPSSTVSDAGRILASPLAKRIASQNQIDLASLQGSGPHGRIIKADVEQAMGQPIASRDSTAPAGPIMAADALFPAYEEIKVTNMRKVIAQRLTESKQTVPHFYLTIDCEIDALLEARKQLNATLPDTQKISVNDFVIKAVASALREVPAANAAWFGATVRQYQSADISVAVAIDGGLVTPIIRAAEAKGLAQISFEMKALAEKARAGKLAPTEFQGGTFSISNLGMFGIKEFAAVINPPQGCILAVGAGEQRPVVRDGQLAVATVMSCTLSVDHRVVDGAVGAAFLAAFKRFITNPVRMIL